MLCGSDKPTFRRLETSEEGEETTGKGHVKRPLSMAKCKALTAEWQHKSVCQVIKNCVMYGVRRAPRNTQMETDT